MKLSPNVRIRFYFDLINIQLFNIYIYTQYMYVCICTTVDVMIFYKRRH